MKKGFINIFLFGFVLLCLTNCITFNPNSEKVITASVPSGNLKYYIRPGKMISENFKDNKAFLMLDFSYQMQNRNYVTDAYANFTLHYKTNSYIDKAVIILPDNIIDMTDISTLDRNTIKGFIRVSSIIQQQNIKQVLEHIHSSKATLQVFLDDGTYLKFIPTKDIIDRITEAFSK